MNNSNSRKNFIREITISNRLAYFFYRQGKIICILIPKSDIEIINQQHGKTGG